MEKCDLVLSIIDLILSFLGIVATIVGFIFAIKELQEMKLQRKQERDSIVLEHSMKAAESFQKIIDNYINFIVNCLVGTDFNNAINMINYTDIKIFDKKEFEKLSKNKKEINEYYDYFDNNNKLEKNIISISRSYLNRGNTEYSEYENLCNYNDCDWELDYYEKEVLNKKDVNSVEYNKIIEKSKNIEYYKNVLLSYFHSNITTLLNKLEVFAIQLNTNLADEEILYQSLHQTYLKTVKYLYPHICFVNSNDAADKYYTNIIELYNVWRDRYIKELDKENKLDEHARTKTIGKEKKL